jgi:DNA-binding response OmpR family regulator
MSAPSQARHDLILVADGDPDIRDIVSVGLERSGYVTIQASTGEEAVRLAREHRPALCILDAGTPRLSGPEVVRTLHDDPATQSVPVLMLTRSNGAEVPDADDYLRKPFRTADLLERVSALRRRRIHAAG